VLGRPLSHAPTEVTDDEAARLTEAYRVLLDLVGDGMALTSAGYLPPKLVEQFAERTGITEWWIGKANREDLTAPRRRRPRDCASARAGFGPEGAAHADRCRRPRPAGPPRPAEAHRRATSAGHQGLRSTRRLDGARCRRQRRAGRTLACAGQRPAAGPRLENRPRPVLTYPRPKVRRSSSWKNWLAQPAPAGG
jgi:hypothetical protein